MSSKNVWVKVLTGFVVGPGHAASIGETLEMPEHAANREVRQGRVELIDPPGPAASPELVETQDPIPTAREPSLKRSK